MNERETVIVLKQSDYRERDVLLTVYTAQFGKISFVATGARRINSKNAGSILPYGESEFLFDAVEGKTLFRLKSAHAISLFRHLRKDLAATAAAGVVCEALDAMTISGDSRDAKRLYAVLKETLSALDEGLDPDTVLSVYLGDILTGFGCRPAVDGCAICGSDTVCALSADEGGFLCAQHAVAKHVEPVDKASLHRFRMIVRAGVKRLSFVCEKGGADIVDADILVNMLEKYAGIRLKTYPFYKTVRGGRTKQEIV